MDNMITETAVNTITHTAKISSDALFTPLFAYIIWVLVLYVVLTFLRAPSVWGKGLNEKGENPFLDIEKRASANLSNQFEWPVLFYAICIILFARPELYQTTHLWLAWLFVVGRVLHSAAQILTTSIRLRGSVFNLNFLAVFFMWGTAAVTIFG